MVYLLHLMNDNHIFLGFGLNQFSVFVLAVDLVSPRVYPHCVGLDWPAKKTYFERPIRVPSPILRRAHMNTCTLVRLRIVNFALLHYILGALLLSQCAAGRVVAMWEVVVV